MFYRRDPGPCIVCGVAHTACTAPVPHVDPHTKGGAPKPATPPLRAEQIQATLPAGSFTTGTYRRARVPKKRASEIEE